MKALTSVLSAACFIALSAQAAHAASLGSIEFNLFGPNSTSPYLADLGGVSPTIADATTNLNQYNGAATLPGGLPDRYDVHIDRTFVGDGNPDTADHMDDRYLFKVDPATLSGTTTNAQVAMTLVSGVNTGIQAIYFSFWEADASGAPVGSALAQITNQGTIYATLSTTKKYMMRLVGNLYTGAQASNIGRYDLVYASAVPVPPALLLILTALGSLFGVRRIRAEHGRA